MSWLTLFFVIISLGIFNMGFIAAGAFVLIGAGVMFMCEVAISYLNEVSE